MRYLTVYFIAIASLLFQQAGAQVLWTTPPFPSDNEPVTVYFDATEGTGGLAGCNCDVYLHAGLITSNSNSPSDWKYVFTQWGVANPDWKMTPVSGQPDVYSYQITPSIRQRFNVTNTNEQILKLAFVFRNGTGTLEGKGVGGTDIFYDVYPANAALSASLQLPSSEVVFSSPGAVLNVKGVSSKPANLYLYDDGNLVASAFGSELNHALQITGTGANVVEFLADDGTEQASAFFTYVVPGPVITESLPAGAMHGINYLSDTDVLFALYAPGKSNVYLIGDFNDWQFSDDYRLKRTPDGNTWWIQIGGLTPGEFYAFQYVVDGSIRIGDPYSELVLDPANDGWIGQETYPDLPPYPTGKTTGIASLMQPGAAEYPWQIQNFQRPEQKNLVIYELLMRDFLATQNYQTLLDTLDYLERLGVTAIEFMPVNEFDGNQSWGYNPTYHYALDKYYGTPDAFKAVVDACHARGMAVILDVVFNHAHEKNPLCMLYWDAANFRPAPNNPWLNPLPKHDFNVFFDFNHESAVTREYVTRTLKHWLTTYKVDGFRFDLSKGLTQNANGPWDAGAYDATRIATLKAYADTIWNTSPGAYVTLEHFAANAEEKELAEYGMMLWTGFGPHNQYMEASMGYPSNLSSISHTSRGWSVSHLIGYMESHDEERMMYKNLTFGNSSGTYNVRNLSTALDRVELASTFFYTVPGPKMLWQFGELGYDYSINWCTNGTVNGCRLDPKPIRWDYLGKPDRLDLYNVTRALLHLKNNYPTFQTSNFQMNAGGYQKTIHLNHSEMDAVVLGNFALQSANVTPNFQHGGWWYEYFTGDSINVSSTSAALNFQPGEYRIYTDERIARPEVYTDSEEQVSGSLNWLVAPNPVRDGRVRIDFFLENAAELSLGIYNLQGSLLEMPLKGRQVAGPHSFELQPALPAGVYLLNLRAGQLQETRKLVVMPN
jgi:glycosidase